MIALLLAALIGVGTHGAKPVKPKPKPTCTYTWKAGWAKACPSWNETQVESAIQTQGLVMPTGFSEDRIDDVQCLPSATYPVTAGPNGLAGNAIAHVWDCEVWVPPGAADTSGYDWSMYVSVMVTGKTTFSVGCGPPGYGWCVEHP